MQSRTMILTVLAGGPLLGLLMGIAANPSMVPAPEPAWRKARPDPIFTESQQFTDAGPQDLSPTWYLDRMPTWKRRAMEREAAAAALQVSAYVPDPPAPPTEADQRAFIDAPAPPAPDADARADVAAGVAVQEVQERDPIASSTPVTPAEAGA